MGAIGSAKRVASLNIDVVNGDERNSTPCLALMSSMPHPPFDRGQAATIEIAGAYTINTNRTGAL